MELFSGFSQEFLVRSPSTHRIQLLSSCFGNNFAGGGSGRTPTNNVDPAAPQCRFPVRLFLLVRTWVFSPAFPSDRSGPVSGVCTLQQSCKWPFFVFRSFFRSASGKEERFGFVLQERKGWRVNVSTIARRVRKVVTKLPHNFRLFYANTSFLIPLSMGLVRCN